MSMLRGGLIFITGFCMAALAQPAGQKPEAEPPSFKIQRNEVIVPVTVTDYKGRFISNLEKSDFKVFEDGREQKIEFFSRQANQPIVLGLVLDLSSGSRIHWENFQKTAQEMVWALLSDERDKKYSGFLVTFSTDAELAVDTTSNPEPIVDKIRTLKPGGGAALYDAIVMAINKHHLLPGEPIEPRRVLIVFGDGNDNASKHSLEQVIELAQRNLVTIYVVSTQAFGFTNEGEDAITRLTDSTGGRVETPLDGVYADVSGYLSKPQDAGNYSLVVGSGAYSSAVSQHMFDAITKVAGEISTQYILRYVPDTTENTRQLRAIKVTVDIPDVTVRTRRGYYPFALQ
ncbi:MAG TPA: VWA domain-containing protein [Bryobacteraceae bacterium]|nr:VWA domain-containing protein [Bryobacteraceae bacterium]